LDLHKAHRSGGAVDLRPNLNQILFAFFCGLLFLNLVLYRDLFFSR